MGCFRRKCTSTVRLDGKTAIITGCNTGIGKYNVLDFYRRGCHVVMACRDLGKAEKAKADIMEEAKNEENLGSIVLEKLDLASLKSVREFADNFLKKEPELHILVNNAGIMACPKSVTEDGFEMQFATNYLGHYLLTLLLLPRLIQSAPSRIVNVSSLAHRIGNIDFNDLNWEKSYSPALAYGRSKLANILFTKELARRLEGTSVTTYALHPGVVRTELVRHVKVCPGCNSFVLKAFGFFCKTVKEGAQTQIYCAVDEKAEKQTGLYYSDCRVARPTAKASNMETARKLWDVSWDMVNLGSYDPFNSGSTSTSKTAW